MYKNVLKGNKNYLKIAGGSSYRGFELPRVKLQQIKSRGNRLWFELARVRVIGSQLYYYQNLQCLLFNLLLLKWYLLGVEKNLGHAHKTRFWYLLGVLTKFSDEHPVTFIGEYHQGRTQAPQHFNINSFCVNSVFNNCTRLYQFLLREKVIFAGM